MAEPIRDSLADYITSDEAWAETFGIGPAGGDR